jgi:citrate synthase
MTEITIEKTHSLLEKLADYVMNEVPRKDEVPTKREMDARFDQVEKRLDRVENDVKLILDGMDTQVKDMEILKTEQIALKSGLGRVEKRVDLLEEKAA